ncbi:MAG: hypothetical protein MJ186_04770, partial [Clostridia bacterium]|nr:hypothetical protein [Clostridia bacterium]
ANKTVNKLAGSANVYASSALWVQMAEKAYEKYLYSVVQERRGVPYKHSFESINWSYTDEFLNSIDPVKTYVQNDGGAGFSNYALKDYYAPNANTNREYLPSENELYSFLEKHVNQEKETITASNSGQVRANDKFARAHGVRVRHIYSIMGVFEKDGKKYVQVRDPRALFRSRYDENGKLINDQSAIMGTLKGGVSNMGTFNLELIDFLKVFDSTAMESGLFYKEYYPMVQSWASKETEKQAEGKGFFDDDLEIIGSDIEAEVKVEPKAEESAPEEAQKEANEAEPELKNPAVDEYAFDSKKDGLAYEFENLDFEDVLGTDGKISPELLEELSTPEGRAQVAGIIEYLASDVEATAMFFGFMNTKPFKDMRDALNRLNKDLKEGTKYTEKNTKDLAKEITDLSKLADTYSDAKYKSIKENQAKGKEPSERAVHRLAAAASLIRLGQGDLNIAAAENSFAESLNIVKGDIETAREKLTGKILTSAEQNTLKHLDNASEVLSNYINSDPVIKDQLGAKAPEKQPEAAKPELKTEEKQTLEETGFLK